MADLFHDKAADWDQRPVPQQISEGVVAALTAHVPLTPAMTVLDFGAGTGLVATKVAPRVKALIAVDVSPAMLELLAPKAAAAGNIEIVCQDLLAHPLARQVDLVVSAMAMHHVADTAALARALFAHTAPGGGVALADLEREDGDFHPPGAEGVFHAGFDRDALAATFTAAGFVAPAFVTACEVTRDGKRYPVFLFTARRPA